MDLIKKNLDLHRVGFSRTPLTITGHYFVIIDVLSFNRRSRFSSLCSRVKWRACQHHVSCDFQWFSSLFALYHELYYRPTITGFFSATLNFSMTYHKFISSHCLNNCNLHTHGENWHYYQITLCTTVWKSGG